MKSLILATNNKKKIVEMKEVLKELDFEIFSLSDKGINIDVEEDGITFEENAKKKAVEIYNFIKDKEVGEFYVLSDDSGLEVDYLNGQPGIYSARYAGEHGNDYKNNLKLIEEMKTAKDGERNARFICALALVNSNGDIKIIREAVEGEILKALSTNEGFGYDPLFLYKPFGKSFSEISIEEKNTISHRGKALIELKKFLSKE